MKATLVIVALFVTACGDLVAGPQRPVTPKQALFEERFSEASFSSKWVINTPNLTGASIQLVDGMTALTMPSGGEGEVTLRRKFEVLQVRGQRLRVTARARTDAPPSSYLRATITVTTDRILPSYSDTASTSTLNDNSWRTLRAVIDIDPNATTAELEFVLRGPGSAWVDDVELAIIGRSPMIKPAKMSAQQVANLMTLTRAVTFIRYLHPSDQAATLAWDEFLPYAIERSLRVSSPEALRNELRILFAKVSPTVAFTMPGEAAAPTSPRISDHHLVRWRRYGLGGPPFAGFREGRDLEIGSAASFTRVDLDAIRSCRSISVRATGRKLTGSGRAMLFAKLLRPGTKADDHSEQFKDTNGEIILTAESPSNMQGIELGIRIHGAAGAVISSLTIACNQGVPYAVDLASDRWKRIGPHNLYTWKVASCDMAATCASLYRNPLDTNFVSEHDVLNASIGNNIIMHLPTAVWSDGRQTLPLTSGVSTPHGDFSNLDLPVRLATISAAWSVLSLFYPYFKDQSIDWLAALPGALEEAAAAQSGTQVQSALAHLFRHLHDNHVRIVHAAAPANGILPITLRRFGDTIIVTGGVPEYLKRIPVGSELLEIDGIAAARAYDQAADQISAATEGLLHYLASLRVRMGTLGTFRRLRIRHSNKGISEYVLPLVDFDLYAHDNRELRPIPGAELAEGVYYVDVDSLSMETWGKLVPKLQSARAIVLDFRGYVTSATLELLSHALSREASSPVWQIPQLPSNDGTSYSISHWNIRPQMPKFDAKLVALVDARSMSAVETALQIFYENRLGLLVGENTGGTNGNVTSVHIPGGFDFRFTGMRVSSSDGSTVQGRGFKPDIIVHPTLEGIRAGRDEILEAGVAAVQRQLRP